jgi:L-2,4-diaminobutyric acid acetyltransferase
MHAPRYCTGDPCWPQTDVAISVNAVTETTVDLRPPTVPDGPALWQLAKDSDTLDVNSPYAYLLWCRDFAATSVIALVGDRPAGFITGYRRPEQPATLVVWQVAVDDAHRGAGIAGRMLDHLFQRLLPGCVTHLETSVTPDNEPSQRLFLAFARRWDAAAERSELFAADLFPAAHLGEELFRIGPLRVSPPR